MEVKFYINAGSGEVEVFPHHKEVVKRWVREPGQMFHRIQVNNNFKLFEDDFDLVDTQPFDTTFTFRITTVTQGTETNFFSGKFRKTDLKNINIDDKRMDVTPVPDDTYEKIISLLDKEFDLFRDIAPPKSRLEYVKQPLLQHYILGTDVITSYLGGVHYETPLDVTAITSGTQLENDYKFFKNLDGWYVAGDETAIDINVTGFYVSDGIGNLPATREDGHYQIVDTGVGSGGRFQILDKLDSDNVVYEAPVNGLAILFFSDPFYDAAGVPNVFPLTSTGDGTSEVAIYDVGVYSRLLTDEVTVGGTATDPIPDPDLSNLSFGYTKAIPVDLGGAISVVNKPIPSLPTAARYGPRRSALAYAGTYFGPWEVANETTYPISPSQWSDISLYFYANSEVRDLQEDGATVRNTECFKLDLLLLAFGSTTDSFLHFGSVFTGGEFLYGATNPISGETKRDIAIVPKSNIKVGDYDQPAQRAIFKLGELFTFLREALNCFWFINAFGSLQIEHLSYFENGGSYLAPVVGIDATTELEPRTGKPWAFQTNKFDYVKEDIPEQITIKWMDQVSQPFEGYPINILSDYAEKGNIQESVIGLFTSDIDFVYSNPSQVSDDGFVVLWCDNFGENLSVPFLEYVVGADEAYKMQNGYLSLVYLIPTFRKHGLPGADVEINRQATTAMTISRNKRQEATFPVPSSFNIINLMRTGLGDGWIEELQVEAGSQTGKYIIRYDTE
jgi:hypothetical protein